MTLALNRQGHTTVEWHIFDIMHHIAQVFNWLLRYDILYYQVHSPKFDAWLPWQRISPIKAIMLVMLPI